MAVINSSGSSTTHAVPSHTHTHTHTHTPMGVKNGDHVVQPVEEVTLRSLLHPVVGATRLGVAVLVRHDIPLLVLLLGYVVPNGGAGAEPELLYNDFKVFPYVHDMDEKPFEQDRREGMSALIRSSD